MTTDQNTQWDRLYETNATWFEEFTAALQNIVGIHPFETRLDNKRYALLHQTPYAAVCKILNNDPTLNRLDSEPHPLPREISPKSPEIHISGIPLNSLLPSNPKKIPFQIFLQARQAPGRMLTNPTQPTVTLTRQEIDALFQTIPEFGALAENSLN